MVEFNSVLKKNAMKLSIIYPIEKLWKGVLISIKLCLIFSIAIMLIFFIKGIFSLTGIIGYLLIGWLIALSIWAGERIWEVAIYQFHWGNNPFFKPLSLVFFWAFSGGISYTCGILLSIKFNFFIISDTALTEYFVTGIFLGCFVPLILHMKIKLIPLWR